MNDTRNRIVGIFTDFARVTRDILNSRKSDISDTLGHDLYFCCCYETSRRVALLCIDTVSDKFIEAVVNNHYDFICAKQLMFKR